MNNKLNEFASILAVMMLADGEFEEQEDLLLQDLEHDTELPGLAIAVKQVISISSLLTDEQLTELLIINANKFDDDEKPKVFEASITALLADGVITEDEISNVLTLAEALEIPTEKAIARLLFQVQESEGRILVDVEEELEEFILVGGRTRFTSWNAFEKMLISKDYPTALVESLELVKNWVIQQFSNNAVINYTPNFMTLSCVNPVSRHKTFCFIRLRKNHIRFEYNGNNEDVISKDGFNETIKNGITSFFNQISKDKV